MGALAEALQQADATSRKGAALPTGWRRRNEAEHRRGSRVVFAA